MNEIQLYLDQLSAPQCLTDLEGEWVDNKQNELLTGLWEKFGDGRNEDCDWVGYKEGDPRLLIVKSKSESLYIALHNGKVGVLTEVELDIGPGEETEIDTNSGTRTLIEADFKHAVEHWKGKVADLITKFPHSTIFLASHAGTWDCRLCLCAFTTLNGQDEQYFTSPYEVGDPITEFNKTTDIIALDKKLNRIAFN